MAERQLPEEFKEFLKCLHSNRVKYLLKKPVKFDGVAVKVLSKPDLIKSKLAAHRPKDLADVAELRRTN